MQTTTLTVTVPQTTADQLDELAQHYGVSQSLLLERLVMLGQQLKTQSPETHITDFHDMPDYLMMEKYEPKG